MRRIQGKNWQNRITGRLVISGRKKKGGEWGKKYFKQESRSGSAIKKDRYELIKSETGLLKKE